MSAATQRWTPARIRAALRFPKPEGAMSRASDFETGRDWWGRRRQPAELTLLRWIADNADVVSAPLPNMVYDGRLARQGQWLLIPMPAQLLDVLAGFEADLLDLEDGGDSEPDQDGELELGAAEEVDQSDAWRVSADREGNLGALQGIDQRKWAEGGDDSEREPDHDVERIDTDDGHGDQGTDQLYAQGILVTHTTLREWRKP